VSSWSYAIKLGTFVWWIRIMTRHNKYHPKSDRLLERFASGVNSANVCPLCSRLFTGGGVRKRVKVSVHYPARMMTVCKVCGYSR